MFLVLERFRVSARLWRCHVSATASAGNHSWRGSNSQMGSRSTDMALLCESQGISRTAMKKVLFLSAFALTTALFFNLSETDCYAWHDTRFVTLVRMRPARADTTALGSLSPEARRKLEAQLVVLCHVESFPEADGLLCGQRSYGTISPNNKGALLFQDGIHARR